MESSSATMSREEDANCDPSPAAPPSAPALLPLPSASSKRRWSPCTWRYAIEEVQAELPSRARSALAASAGAGAPPSSSRPPSQQHHHHQHPQPLKAKPSPHHNPPFCKSAESAQRTPSRGLPSTESRVHVRSLAHSHPHASSKTRVPELFKKSLQHELLSAGAIISEEEDDEADEDDDDDDNDDGDDMDLRVATCFDEEYFKRRRREMSPSELYFCAECSHAKGVAKFLHD